MNLRAITSWLIVAAVVILGGYDLIPAFMNKQPGDTISEVMLSTARNVPLVPLAFGILIGHLFGAGMWLRPAIGFVAQYPIIPFIIGTLIGMLMWAQLR